MSLSGQAFYLEELTADGSAAVAFHISYQNVVEFVENPDVNKLNKNNFSASLFADG